ncbi:hypothetical protein NOR53_838 [gamma proteobacterium NOR5-3]|nr:hypothetical protein NOR53_838 [gamma proteobacterium NOR5-3]
MKQKLITAASDKPGLVAAALDNKHAGGTAAAIKRARDCLRADQTRLDALHRASQDLKYWLESIPSGVVAT